MKTRFSIGVAASAILSFVTGAAILESQSPPAAATVKVEGGLVSGVSADGVRSYKGIPFAAPPVGDLRWKPPQPVKAWSGTRRGDAVGPACPQNGHPPGPFPDPTEAQREDCLSLNVWTAAPAGERRPVIVWYHGGGWAFGSGVSYTPNGAPLAKKGIVLVTVNSRLGALGYLAHPELTAESAHHSSGNYGFLDQIAALHWVRQNVAAFGGDPNRVTIMGESAGSWTVSMLVASPLSRGLFQRAIGESGGRFGPQSYLHDDRNGFQAAENVGLQFARTAGVDSIAALRALPPEKILKMQFRTLENVDGWALPDEVRTLYAQGKQAKVPVLVGSNRNERTPNPATAPKTIAEYRAYLAKEYGASSQALETAYPVKTDADIVDAVAAIAGQSAFTVHMRTWARRMAAAGQKTFLYEFTHVPPHPNSKQLGAFHTSEIPYVFNDLKQPRLSDWRFTETDSRVANVMSSYWTNFVIHGDPNGEGLPRWAPYDPTNEGYMDLGDTPVLRNHLLKQQLDAIEGFQQQRQSTSR
jgi:para-nitrobenzyl esterase